MRGYQASFASGEINPLLHGRIDLQRYATGLSRLENMIVLPQGGVTRRAGFTKLGAAVTAAGVRLIPFVYNATDSVMLEFGNNRIRVWGQTESGYDIVSTISSPYSYTDVKDLRYVQSGNVIFLAHRKYKPMILTRESMRSWGLKELSYYGGPFIEGNEWSSGTKLKLSGTGRTRTITSTGGNIFNSGLVGTLIKVEYAVEPKSGSITSKVYPSEGMSNAFEVKGTLNVTTSGEWRGIVSVERSSDGGVTWVTMRQYRRENTDEQGQWDLTLTETESGILYRVKAQHNTLRTADQKEPIFQAVIDNDYKMGRTTEAPVSMGVIKTTGEVVGSIMAAGSTNGTGHTIDSITTTVKFEPETVRGSYSYTQKDTDNLVTKIDVLQKSSVDDTPITIIISASGYLKSEIYKITSVNSGNSVTAEIQNGSTVNAGTENTSGSYEISLWSMGAWGEMQGYPGSIAMYQDRLVFAGTKRQPQTLWMSRTGDYADFGVSDPLREDDAINITLAGTSSDGIHSLVSSGSLLAFTRSGEWNIKGSGESGAISPTGIAAYEQSTIGSKSIQPIAVNGKIILIQAQGQKVYALGYDLNTDGYTGSEISIMSGQIFENKEINSLAYQKIPDSLLWFALSDGTAAVCTYNPEHEVIGWSRQSNPEIRFNTFSSIPGTNQSEIFCTADKAGVSVILYGRNRVSDEDYRDDGVEYESIMRTLRLTGSGEDGVIYASKKLIARIAVYALNSKQAWAAPKEWERRQRIRFEETDGLRESEIELDNGFDTDACIQLRNAGNEGLTIAAISPVMTVGG